MLHNFRHYLLALLMILQSVSSAWAQVQVIGAQPASTQAMQPGEHCTMTAMNADDARAFQDIKGSKSKSDCPCCDKQCVQMHCATAHLQAALPLFAVSMQFAAAAFTASRFSQVADRHYLTPPTPPPNTLQN